MIRRILFLTNRLAPAGAETFLLARVAHLDRTRWEPIVGELRLQGGAQGGTRFSLPVDLASPADKTFILYAQPPSFGQQLEVALVSGDQTIAKQKVAFTVHDPGQLIVGA